MECRICYSHNVERAGGLRAYLDYYVDIFDCAACGCRFTRRDDSVYERLHSEANSTYNIHKQFALATKQNFDNRNIRNLEYTLCEQAKNRFILNAAKTLGPGARVMEVGCSLGYLTSWFIAQGIEIIGTDISQTAIDEATALFGSHFYLATDPAVEFFSPYDFIYHAGTIGCVGDPIGLTHYWLSLLKPGGKLVFNAPNKALADQLGKLWPHLTTPPDLVTLFPPEFWKMQFSSVANVSTQTIWLNQREAAMYRWIPAFIMRAKPNLFKSNRASRFVLRVIKLLTRSIIAALYDTSDSPLPADFGVMITMRKH